MKKLSKLLTKSGKITIAALDHRGSLKKALNPQNPESTTSEEVLKWKKEMVELYENEVSGILIDPIYGKELVDSAKECGWLLSMEKSGYRGGKEERVTELLPDWSVGQAREMGAVGVKLLLYYDPDNESLARKQWELAALLARECEREEVIFLLEPLSYQVEGSREEEVLRIAREIARIPADIYKFEYPGSKQGCEQLSEILPKPWVLLSAGMKYEMYKKALEEACESGCSGMAVGRAVWQEFEQYQGEERERFLRETSLMRMRELAAIVEGKGKPVR